MLILAATLLETGLAISLSSDRPRPITTAQMTDHVAYRHIALRVRARESYYEAASRELRFHHFPTRSVFNWRTPLYAWSLGALPAPEVAWPLLVAISLTSGLMAALLMVRDFPRPARLLAMLSVIVASGWCLHPPIAFYTEVWCGHLIFISLCLASRGWLVVGAAIGLLALFLRELALPYCAIAAAIACATRRRLEAFVWLLGLLAYGFYFARHHREVARLGTVAKLSGDDWIAFGGLKFLLATCRMSFPLALAPAWLLAIYLTLSLIGLFGLRGEIGLRTGLVVLTYALAFSIVGQDFNSYWGWVYTPLLSLGVALSPYGLRNLLTCAFRH
ncbi:MAG: hypothetical protein P4L84_03295 [Isosphaeraceae bacterium]|nr:hypothetical protein [Isosphaeraceae bacterium]